jgi:hypothetical protein
MQETSVSNDALRTKIMFCHLHLRNKALVAGLVSSVGKKLSSLPPQDSLKDIETYAADRGISKIVFRFRKNIKIKA